MSTQDPYVEIENDLRKKFLKLTAQASGMSFDELSAAVKANLENFAREFMTIHDQERSVRADPAVAQAIKGARLRHERLARYRAKGR